MSVSKRSPMGHWSFGSRCGPFHPPLTASSKFLNVYTFHLLSPGSSVLSGSSFPHSIATTPSVPGRGFGAGTSESGLDKWVLWHLVAEHEEQLSSPWAGSTLHNEGNVPTSDPGSGHVPVQKLQPIWGHPATMSWEGGCLVPLPSPG